MNCRHLVVAITGAVAAAIMPRYVFYLRETFAERISVLMSAHAQRFVTPYAMELHSGHSVFTDAFEIREEVRVPHISLTRDADLFVVMPATANIMGKVAHGICDDLISSAILASRCPVVFVPSMNESMWDSKIVQMNVERLRLLGHHVIEPDVGFEVADGQRTYGAMGPINKIVTQLEIILGGVGSR